MDFATIAANKTSPTDVARFVLAHLLAQGVPAVVYDDDDDNPLTCAYLDAEGRTCAAGCLIPEGRYTTAFEGNGVVTVLDELFGTEFVALNFSGEMIAVLRALQTIHDSHEDDGIITQDSLRERVAAIYNTHPQAKPFLTEALASITGA